MTKQEAFDFLYHLAEEVSTIFGSSCETVVQEIEDGKFYTVAIFNGHVSGRKAMSTQGILGGTLETDQIDYEKVRSGVYNQLVKHPSGKKIKSSSFPLKGDDYFYIFGINYDISLLENMGYFINNFISFEGDLFTTLKQEKDNSLESLFDSCLKLMNTNADNMKKSERLLFISALNDHNFFQIQKSVPFLSEKLGVSKYTIYKDLNELGASHIKAGKEDSHG